MEPHLQRGESPGPLHRIGYRPGSDHQAGGGQDPPAVRFFDRLVYRNGETEVVAGDDKLSHKALSRATMRPSRVRTNSLSRQTVVGFIKARSKETTAARSRKGRSSRSEEHTSELQSPCNLVCRLLLEKKKERC